MRVRRYGNNAAIPDDSNAAWNDPMVKKANAEVRIESVLTDYFATPVPLEASSWKTYCPFRTEHEDGGLDRQFRIYSESNRAHCFAMHGTLDPVKLWRTRRSFPSMRAAAEDLMTAYGVEFRPRRWTERRAERLASVQSFEIEPESVTDAMMVFLEGLEGYADSQYDENVLRVVNSVLSEVHPLCAGVDSMEEVEKWYQQARVRLRAAVMSSPSSRTG